MENVSKEDIDKMKRMTNLASFTCKRQLEKSSSFEEAIMFYSEHVCDCGSRLSYDPYSRMMDASYLNCRCCGQGYVFCGRTGKLGKR